MTTDDPTVFDKPHHQSLELLAAMALAEGNPVTAFKFSDRRCRVFPLPEPHCYVLRGEASFQIGAQADARADIARALYIAPDHIAANRRMLAWGQGEQKLKAARALVGHDHNFDFLKRAIQVLQEHGKGNIAKVTVLDDEIEGWAVWQDQCPLDVSITDGIHQTRTTFAPAASHALSEYGRAVNFRVRRPKSAHSQLTLLSVSGNIFHTVSTACNDVKGKTIVHSPSTESVHKRPVTVIVPVYGDYEATRLCLNSLRRELHSSRDRAILVNDATPDPRIAKYLAKLGKEAGIDVIVNDLNLGFVGSVNRAIDHVKRGDIIILNSDTIVPPGFIDRLAAAAAISPEIGTVTPFSNNGEFTSFPIPNTSNPLPSLPEIKRIDDIAAKANAGRVIDIPSGIGFCLYITRTCIDMVGPLSEEFGHGYLEDADFCLRARQHGFRNVCAPSVYVGHAGSKSFKDEKRSLVVHNLGLLEQRFPEHRSECAAFMAADSLRSAREAIERALAAETFGPCLVVTGTGAIGIIARERARRRVSDGQIVWILEVHCSANGAMIRIKNASGEIPQSLQFDLTSSDENESLFEFLVAAEPSRIELVDPTKAPISLVHLLQGLNVPYDILIADAGLLGPDADEAFVDAVRSLVTRPCNKHHEKDEASHRRAQEWANHWQAIAGGAENILVSCAEAAAFAAVALPHRTVHKIEGSQQRRHPAIRKWQKSSSSEVGFVPARTGVQEQLLIREVAHGLARARPDISITVLGATLNDLELMRNANTFVTGPVNPEEFERLITTLGLGRIFISTTTPLFGHPLHLVARSSLLPIAYFDWSKGHVRAESKDLAIDPSTSFGGLVDALDQWVQ